MLQCTVKEIEKEMKKKWTISAKNYTVSQVNNSVEHGRYEVGDSEFQDSCVRLNIRQFRLNKCLNV